MKPDDPVARTDRALRAARVALAALLLCLAAAGKLLVDIGEWFARFAPPGAP